MHTHWLISYDKDMVQEQQEAENSSIILEYFNDQYTYRGRNGYYNTHTVGELLNHTEVEGMVKDSTAQTSSGLVSSSRSNINGVNMPANSASASRKDVNDGQSLSLTSRGITLALGTSQRLTQSLTQSLTHSLLHGYLRHSLTLAFQ